MCRAAAHLRAVHRGRGAPRRRRPCRDAQRSRPRLAGIRPLSRILAAQAPAFGSTAWSLGLPLARRSAERFDCPSDSLFGLVSRTFFLRFSCGLASQLGKHALDEMIKQPIAHTPDEFHTTLGPKIQVGSAPQPWRSAPSRRQDRPLFPRQPRRGPVATTIKSPALSHSRSLRWESVASYSVGSRLLQPWVLRWAAQAL